MKKIILYIVTIALIFSLSVKAFAVEAPQSKEEVVYGILNSNGNLQEVYIVNSFKGGNFVDYGNYSKVQNLTNTKLLDYQGDMISMATQKGAFYYQGTMAVPVLPWEFSVHYFLDEVEMTASQLAGKSGKLEIVISTKANETIDQGYFDNFMLQVSATLNTELASNIVASKATIASAGKNKLLNFTILPGKTASFSILADVIDFEMEGLQFAAVPLNMSIELPETEDMLGEMSQLTDAISELNFGVQQFSSGVSQTYQGSKEIAAGSEQLSNGLDTLSSNSAPLLDGSAQILAGLEGVSEVLDGMGDFDADTLTSLSEGLKVFADNLDNMTELTDGMERIFALLKEAFENLPEIKSDDLSSLSDLVEETGNDDQNNTLDDLIQYYRIVKIVKDSYVFIEGALDSLGVKIEDMEISIADVKGALNDIADLIDSLNDSGIFELIGGLGEMVDGYREFHDGLSQYFEAVETLNQGYKALNVGIHQLSGGLKELNSGASQLADGTNLLQKETDQLPELVEEKIQDLLKEFDKSDYVPKSFASEKNTNVLSVQFVVKTAGITKDPVIESVIQEVKSESFWEKLFGLFGF